MRFGKISNERSGTAYNFVHYPTDVVLLVVFYYYHFKNSLVDMTEHMALRGFSIIHETVRLWSQQFGTAVINIPFQSAAGELRLNFGNIKRHDRSGII